MAFNEIVTANDDERYMLEALIEAQAGAEEGEVPVGAVIVKDEAVIAKTHNLIESRGRSSAHAEMLAIEAAENAIGAKWLTGCTMYVTLEPCSMCAGAMILARIDRLVYGAEDPKTGACGSLFNIAGSDSLNHRIEVTGGVLEKECSEILKDFFKARRKQQ